MPFTATAYIPSIKPGIYPAVCTDVEDATSKEGNEFRIWHAQLTDGTLRTISGSSSRATSPKSKGGKWAAALIGHAPVDGEVIEPEGKPCTIVVAIKEATGYEYIESILAPTLTTPAGGVTAAHPESSDPANDLPF